jgi:hypothetical protein
MTQYGIWSESSLQYTFFANSDGAGLSCVLGSVMMVMEQLEVDGHSSLFSTARLIHNARPQALRTQVL